MAQGAGRLWPGVQPQTPPQWAACCLRLHKGAQEGILQEAPGQEGSQLVLSELFKVNKGSGASGSLLLLMTLM